MTDRSSTQCCERCSAPLQDDGQCSKRSCRQKRDTLPAHVIARARASSGSMPAVRLTSSPETCEHVMMQATDKFCTDCGAPYAPRRSSGVRSVQGANDDADDGDSNSSTG
ncbi:MAG: hypothetical protein WA001_00585 [Patescibacteria group bacterium]